MYICSLFYVLGNAFKTNEITTSAVIDWHGNQLAGGGHLAGGVRQTNSKDIERKTGPAPRRGDETGGAR
jgi:hypothetical protein